MKKVIRKSKISSIINAVKDFRNERSATRLYGFASVYGNQRFEAKIHVNDSKYGIEGDCVSSLIISQFSLPADQCMEVIIAHYDRGWVIRPETAYEREVFEQIRFFVKQWPALTMERHQNCLYKVRKTTSCNKQLVKCFNNPKSA